MKCLSSKLQADNPKSTNRFINYIVDKIKHASSGLPRLSLTELSYGVGNVVRAVNNAGQPW